VLKPAFPGTLVPFANETFDGVTRYAPPYNLSASYMNGCAATLTALACPNGSAFNPGTSIPGTGFQCQCGGFDSSTRVAEDSLDFVMGAFMAGVAAQAAAARGGTSCPSTALPLMYEIVIGVLGGVVLLGAIAAVVHCACCRARACGCGAGASTATPDWGVTTAKANPASRLDEPEGANPYRV